MRMLRMVVLSTGLVLGYRMPTPRLLDVSFNTLRRKGRPCLEGGITSNTYKSNSLLDSNKRMRLWRLVTPNRAV